MIILMKSLRKYFASFFLVIVSLPLVLSFLFAGEQIYAHLENENKNEFCIIRIRKTDLIWIKKDKELAVQGKMFDVKKIKNSGEFIELYGYYDEAEDRLFSFFYSLFAGDDSNKIQSHQLLSFVFFSEIGNQNLFSGLQPDDTFKIKYIHLIESALLHRSDDVISPPPNYS